METLTIEEDINTIYIHALSFPDGIEAAHEKLHSLFPNERNRQYFGISYPKDGHITYKAATSVISETDKDLNLNTFTIKKGKYISLLVLQYKQNITSISNAFQLLLEQVGIDPEGYCLEWYINESDVRCMIPLSN